MKGFYKKYNVDRIRPYLVYGLIFFIFIAILACRSGNGEMKLVWKDKKATAILIPANLTNPLKSDTWEKELQIRLVGDKQPVPILGEFTKDSEGILFTPLIPFTRGLRYEIFARSKRIATFDVPPADPKDAPALIGIYPTSDTLPENLLKIYLRFSQPMRDGQSKNFVTLVKNEIDTVKGAFLDLQPELWNEDRTMLTLWLDPGRIKRDLQPNKLLGAPMKKNTKYQILVSAAWTDLQGLSLPQTYHKNFVTTTRDSLSPAPRAWKITASKAGTTQAFQVDFGEKLDYGLLSETLSIRNQNGLVAGKWAIGNGERSIQFFPDQKWQPGNYFIRIETRLEDLAGNNINRPFDRDITSKAKVADQGDFTQIPLVIKN